MPFQWVICGNCGKIDAPNKAVHRIGTAASMRCADCAGDDGKARLCRLCCPTAHGTKLAGCNGCFDSPCSCLSDDCSVDP